MFEIKDHYAYQIYDDYRTTALAANYGHGLSYGWEGTLIRSSLFPPLAWHDQALCEGRNVHYEGTKHGNSSLAAS